MPRWLTSTPWRAARSSASIASSGFTALLSRMPRSEPLMTVSPSAPPEPALSIYPGEHVAAYEHLQPVAQLLAFGIVQMSSQIGQHPQDIANGDRVTRLQLQDQTAFRL